MRVKSTGVKRGRPIERLPVVGGREWAANRGRPIVGGQQAGQTRSMAALRAPHNDNHTTRPRNAVAGSSMEGFRGYNGFKSALLAWAAADPPMPFNGWQPGVAQIRNLSKGRRVLLLQREQAIPSH